MSRTKSFKRILSSLCTLCLLFSLLVNGAYAVVADEGMLPEQVVEIQEAASEEGPGIAAEEPATPDKEELIGGDDLTAPPKDGVGSPSADETTDDEKAVQRFTEDGFTATDESEEDALQPDVGSAEREESTPDEGKTEPEIEEIEADSEGEPSAAFWNDVPISSHASKDGVTITVTAPEESFPQGTGVQINTLGEAETNAFLSSIGKGDAAVGFDISFLTYDGQRIQPRAGSLVDVSFMVGADSVLADDEDSGATLRVYHIADNGSVETLMRTVAPVHNTAKFNIASDAFSPYIIVKESQKPPAGKNRDATVSTNLADFLVSVDIDALVDEQGNYIVDPNSSYEMTLRFSESENFQFADEEILTYDFPNGVVVSDLSPTTFTLDLTDQYGTATISGTYEVVNGQLRVRFNQDDPNFERLKAAPNANFGITITSSYDQTEGEIEFAPGIVKEFVFDDSADVNITKHVAYDQNTDTATYVLQVSSAGRNENVVIEDHLTGTALIFNQDVTIESNINGVVSAAPDYTGVENGFRVSIPQMANGEILTLRYTATVDNDIITGTGTVEQTNNTARVASDQVPEGKEANADFHGDVTFHQVNKSRMGEPVLLDDGSYEATWLVRVNMDHKLTVGGTEIRDWVGTASQPFMQFGGEGLSVEVRFENGSTEMRTIAWSELTTTTNDKGIVSWSYTPPVSDGKAAYQITCKTIIDPTGALGNLSVTNYALFNGKETSASQTVQVVTGDGLRIQKERVGTTDTESEWRITVTVPGAGLPDLRIVDTFPRMTYAVGVRYYDGYLDGSLDVTSGLFPGESWDLYVGSDEHAFTLTFYQDAEKAVPGVLPTTDGQPRNIEIRFKTTVNQDWLTHAVEDEYQDYHLYAHFNHTYARSLDYRTPDAEAYAVPIRPDFVKNFVGRSDEEIDGVTYPVFRYSLGMYGPLEDGVTIHDAFNTTYLRFYEGDDIQIFGGFNYTPTDNNGTISVTETADGMDILVSSFPKASNGDFYPYYSIGYTLIVKDADALDALNEDAAMSQNGIQLENTASWGDLESGSEVTYSYFPYVDKELVDRPSADNGYVAEFKVIVNKYAEDLDPSSDVLAIRDILSYNLRFLPDTLVISPAVDSIEVQHDPDTNTLTFLNVPDERVFEISYQVRVLGQGNVTYSNTIQFGKYEKTIEESAVVSSSGGGSASNPSITLVKRDADSISTTLAGATFQLYYLQGGDMVPVVDRSGNEVFFTTGGDGSVLIVGNQQTLGWALWTGRTYCLVEISAPIGYELNREPAYFVLSETPSSQIEYDITGDQFSVQNTLMRISIPVMKQWIGPAVERVTVRLLADGERVAEAVLSGDNLWQHTFPDLPEYDSTDGHRIVYRIEEPDLPGYRSEIIPNEDGSFTVVNTTTETIDIPVTKQWVGAPADAVTVKLTADGEVIDTAELSEAGGWRHTFTGLPKYDGTDGHEIQYDVTEEAVEGYSPGRSGTAETGFTFTNTIAGKVSIPVTKEWIGPAAERITVHLLADGERVAEAVLSEDNLWQHTFPDLDRYKKDGTAIDYKIEEVRIEGYASEIAGDMTGFTITNTNLGTRNIPVEKRWEGDALTGVTIRLLADGKEIGSVILEDENSWKHTFENVLRFDADDGHEIVYTVTEDRIEGYTVSITGDATEGFVITNTAPVTPPDGPTPPPDDPTPTPPPDDPPPTPPGGIGGGDDPTPPPDGPTPTPPPDDPTPTPPPDGPTPTPPPDGPTPTPPPDGPTPTPPPDDPPPTPPGGIGGGDDPTPPPDSPTPPPPQDTPTPVTPPDSSSPPYDTPKTGDNSHPLLYLLLLLASGGGLVLVGVTSKKRKRNK